MVETYIQYLSIIVNYLNNLINKLQKNTTSTIQPIQYRISIDGPGYI